MQKLLCTLTVLAWGSWFGAIMALFCFVQTIFMHDRNVAIMAAPLMFLAYQKYHLVLAVIVLATTVAWRILVPTPALVAAFILFAIAASCGAVVAIWVIEPMEKLRIEGMSGTPEFRKLHGQSMILYVTQAAALLGAGIMILQGAWSKAERTSPQTVPATGFPV